MEATHSKWDYGGLNLKEIPNASGCSRGEEDVAWQPSYEGTASDQVVYPTLMAIDKADFLAYVKQDGQKADDAKVPTHLWSFFFKNPSFNTLV